MAMSRSARGKGTRRSENWGWYAPSGCSFRRSAQVRFDGNQNHSLQSIPFRRAKRGDDPTDRGCSCVGPSCACACACACECVASRSASAEAGHTPTPNAANMLYTNATSVASKLGGTSGGSQVARALGGVCECAEWTDGGDRGEGADWGGEKGEQRAMPAALQLYWVSVLN